MVFEMLADQVGFGGFGMIGINNGTGNAIGKYDVRGHFPITGLATYRLAVIPGERAFA